MHIRTRPRTRRETTRNCTVGESTGWSEDATLGCMELLPKWPRVVEEESWQNYGVSVKVVQSVSHWIALHCIAVVVPTPVFYSTGLMVVDVCAKNGGTMGLVCGNLHKTCHEIMVYHTLLCFCLRIVLLISIQAMQYALWMTQSGWGKPMNPKSLSIQWQPH